MKAKTAIGLWRTGSSSAATAPVPDASISESADTPAHHAIRTSNTLETTAGRIRTYDHPINRRRVGDGQAYPEQQAIFITAAPTPGPDLIAPGLPREKTTSR